MTLDALLAAYAKRTHARWWTGARPDVREGQVARTIASEVGLPTTPEPYDVNALVRLNSSQATHMLAVAGTTSLAYGRALPRKQALADASAALSGFTRDATFLSNAVWDDAPSLSRRPLTSATFECGVIGYDERIAFIFWVEEED